MQGPDARASLNSYLFASDSDHPMLVHRMRRSSPASSLMTRSRTVWHRPANKSAASQQQLKRDALVGLATPAQASWTHMTRSRGAEFEVPIGYFQATNKYCLVEGVVANLPTKQRAVAAPDGIAARHGVRVCQYEPFKSTKLLTCYMIRELALKLRFEIMDWGMLKTARTSPRTWYMCQPCPHRYRDLSHCCRIRLGLRGLRLRDNETPWLTWGCGIQRVVLRMRVYLFCSVRLDAGAVRTEKQQDACQQVPMCRCSVKLKTQFVRQSDLSCHI